VASAELEPEEIAYPVRSILRGRPRSQFALAMVESLDLAGRRVLCDGPPIPYDYLVLAMGSVSHFFGTPGAAEYALPLKTVDHGIALRNHILEMLERAVRESLDRVAGAGFVHVSLDMDVLDPDVAPGVGTPVRGGLTYREAHLALELVAESRLAGSLEVVEVNPILDRENTTALTAVELVASALGKTIF